MNRITLMLTCWFVASPAVATPATDTLEFDGWRPFCHRNETSPDFEIRREGGPRGRGGLVIRHDDRTNLLSQKGRILSRTKAGRKRHEILPAHVAV